MSRMLAEHFMAKDAPLTSPPFHEATLIMLATGWTFTELMATPDTVVRETMDYHNTRIEVAKANG